MRLALCVGLAAVAPSLVAAQGNALSSGVRQWRELVAHHGPAATMIAATPTTTLASLQVDVVTMRAPDTSHVHVHHADVEELIIVESGRLRVTVNGLRRSVGRASVAVIFPGDEHDLAPVGSDPVTYYRFVYRSKRGIDSTRAHKAGGSFIVDWNDVVLQPSPTGGVRRIFDRATAMVERFEMHASTLNQGLTNHPAHTHGAEEAVVMLRGDVRMLIGTERQGATSDDLIFLASNIPHSLDNTGKGTAEYFAFQWQ